MTMFADCREKYTKNAYPYGTKFRKQADIPDDEINPYWNGNSKGEDKAEIRGYDWAVDQTDNFFNNTECGEELEEYLTNEEKRILREINSKITTMDNEGETPKLEDVVTESTPRVVKAILATRYDLCDWLERERDMVITSLIENGNYEEKD